MAELRSRRLARPLSEALAPDSGRVAATGAALSLNSGSTRRREPGLVFSLAAAHGAAEPSLSTTRLLFRRPLALLSLVPTELSMFIAGGVAGAIAKTTTAPLDRVSAAAVLWAAVPLCAVRGALTGCTRRSRFCCKCRASTRSLLPPRRPPKAA